MSNQHKFGSAVEGGVLRYTSASAVQTFDPETYAGCNRKWYFTRVLGMKEPTTKSQEVGQEGHGQIEHYLKTGEDVLQPFARAGKHLLPRPGADLEVEKSLTSGLVVAGVPFVGYIDFRHRRGEYVSEDGALVKEARPEETCEIVDNKFSSDIDAFGKSAAEIAHAVQMVSYAIDTANTYPDVKHIRLGHIYYQTRGAKTAKKVTALVTVDDARRRWERVGKIVDAMKQVAHISRVEDVKGSFESCDAYRGCYFKNVCPGRPTRGLAALLQLGKGESMGAGLFDPNGVSGSPPPLPALAQPSLPRQGLFESLLGSPAASPPPIPPAPPLPDSDYQARVEAERTRLLGEEAGSKQACGASGCGVGCAPGFVLSDHGYVYCPTCQGHGKPAVPALPPPVGAINPPDGPVQTVLAGAAPLPPEVIEGIEDPELRARVEAHAAIHKERADAQAAAIAARAPEKTSGNCPGGKTRVKLTNEQAGSKRFPCPDCGKELKIKPSSDYTEATLPGHRIAKEEPALPLAPTLASAMPPPASPPLPVPTLASAMPPPAPPPASPPPPAPPPSSLIERLRSYAPAHALAMPPPAPPPPASPPPAPPPLPVPTLASAMPPPASTRSAAEGGIGITLYIDVVIDKGVQPVALDTYVADMVATIAKTAGLYDIRIADGKHEMGFGRWKGWLAAAVRADLPKPGAYVVRNVASSEILSVVVEAIAPHCAQVIRGVR